MILDLQLGCEDGRALLRLLMARFGAHAPPAIVCSGRGGELPPGAVGRFAKPFLVRDVLEAVRRFVGAETCPLPPVQRGPSLDVDGEDRSRV